MVEKMDGSEIGLTPSTQVIMSHVNQKTLLTYFETFLT